MRRIGIGLGLAAVGLVLIAAAPVQPPRLVIPAKSASASGLRGAQSAKPAKPPPAPILAAASLPASEAIPADPGQCRLGCAHSYYFCLAGQDAAFCPQSWTSCLNDCGRAPIQP